MNIETETCTSAAGRRDRSRRPLAAGILFLMLGGIFGGGCAAPLVTVKNLPQEAYAERYFVTLGNVAPQDAIAYLTGPPNSTLEQVYSTLLPETYLLTITGDSGATLQSLLADVDGAVSRVNDQLPVELSWRQDVIIRSLERQDPLVPEQWSLQRRPGVNLPVTDEAPITPPHAVAVIDSGVLASHPDLEGRVALGMSAIHPDSEAGANSDAWGHGTRIAGIIAAAWLGALTSFSPYHCRARSTSAVRSASSWLVAPSRQPRISFVFVAST